MKSIYKSFKRNHRMAATQQKLTDTMAAANVINDIDAKLLSAGVPPPPAAPVCCHHQGGPMHGHHPRSHFVNTHYQITRRQAGFVICSIFALLMLSIMTMIIGVLRHSMSEYPPTPTIPVLPPPPIGYLSFVKEYMQNATCPAHP